MDLLNIEAHQVVNGTLGKHFLLYGDPGTRKTTVASDFSKPLFLATEIGYQFIPGVKAVHIDSWYTFIAVLRELKKEDVRAEYDTIVIDTLSLLTEQCTKYVCDLFGIQNLGDVGYGKGWIKYRKEMSEAFNLIAQLGYGIVFISHSKESFDDSGEIDGVGPGLDNTTLKIVNALADMIFYVAKGKTADDKQTVFALNNTGANILTKSRVQNFPSKIEFDFKTLDSELTKAINQIENLDVVEDIKEVKPIIESERRPLEEVKESILALAQESASIGQSEVAAEILGGALKGTKLSEVNNSHYDSMVAAEHALKQLVS